MRADAAVAEHVHVGFEEVFEVLPEPDEVEQAAAGLHLDEQVDVAVLLLLAAGGRPEDADVAGSVPLGAIEDLRAPHAQPPKLCALDGHLHGHVTASCGGRIALTLTAPVASERGVLDRSGERVDERGGLLDYVEVGALRPEYAAWRVSNATPIVLLDTRTGHRDDLTPPAGCSFYTAASSADRFIAEGEEGEHRESEELFDVKTGQLTSLPSSAPDGEKCGWFSIGSRHLLAVVALGGGDVGVSELPLHVDERVLATIRLPRRARDGWLRAKKNPA